MKHARAAKCRPNNSESFRLDRGVRLFSGAFRSLLVLPNYREKRSRYYNERDEVDVEKWEEREGEMTRRRRGVAALTSRFNIERDVAEMLLATYAAIILPWDVTLQLL